jgi:prepilin-type N-terminal cleavage/methylation domain-containing protein
MLTKRGFTLIELLVVIAIITILASIVAPRVSNWIERGKMAKAVSEVRNADLALTKMLADVERKHFGQVLAYPLNFVPSQLSYAQAVKMYTAAFYELLRKGKNADLTYLPLDDNVPPLQTVSLGLKSGMERKLGTTYMDMNLDPWGKAYQFYAGPLKIRLDWQNLNEFPPFRSCRGEGYLYGTVEKQALDVDLRGNPPADGRDGFPCPLDLPIYIFSWGGNGVPNQPWLAPSDVDLGIGGGDDINNWDTGSGWAEFY